MGSLFKHWVGDPALVLAVLVMTSFGIAMIYSAGVLNVPSPITEGAWILQIQWAAISLVAFVVIRQIGPRWIEWVAMPAYVVSILLLLITLFVGTGSGTAAGVKSFLEIGPMRFQPSELAKLATILALARYLGTRPEDPATLRALVNPAAIVGVPLVLVILQPDLGTALAFVGILFAALFWAGTPIGLMALLMSPGISLVLSFDRRIWAASFVFLVFALYLYRYRLFLWSRFPSSSRTGRPARSPPRSGTHWPTISRIAFWCSWTRASIPGERATTLCSRWWPSGAADRWERGLLRGHKNVSTFYLSSIPTSFFPSSERNWGTWERSSLCRFSRSSSIGS